MNTNIIKYEIIYHLTVYYHKVQHLASLFQQLSTNTTRIRTIVQSAPCIAIIHWNHRSVSSMYSHNTLEPSRAVEPCNLQ